ncbi:MAG: hypothetical protein ACJAT2_001524 [Bacteriovoracaceae bacterium]
MKLVLKATYFHQAPTEQLIWKDMLFAEGTLTEELLATMTTFSRSNNNFIFS